MMKKAVYILFLLALNNAVWSQQQFGSAWVLGNAGIVRTTRFNINNSLNQYYLGAPGVSIWFNKGQSNICDSAGRLILLSDGYNLYDSNLNYIDGGQKLCFDSLYSLGTGTVCSESQWSVILPFNNGLYYFVNSGASDYCISVSGTVNYIPIDFMLYHKVDMKENGGAGKVIERMKVLEQGRFASTTMMACRHANGKDWWLLKLGGDSITFYTYLFKQDSVIVKGEQKFPGLLGTTLGALNGQIMFNSDGSKMMCVTRLSDRTYHFDFNRCTGVLSNPVFYNSAIDSLPDPAIEGGCFSPDNRFFYIAKYYHIWQYDLQAPDSASAWYKVAGLDTTYQAFQSYSNIYPGPDGKIYIGNWNGLSNQMSVINKPNEKGIACEFCPRCLRFDTVYNYGGISQPPCMPNYNLGEDLSICWPLEISEFENEKISELVVYPNPTTGKFQIKNSKFKSIKELYNSVGQLILSTMENEMDVSHLSKGIYYLRCENQSVKVVVE